jgi:glycosyltransferase involved in cell wall biosynthesis
MIKVCHVISGYHRTDARVFQRQCKTLVKAGFEVCILTNDGQPDEEIEGIKVYTTDKFWRNRIKVILCAKYQFLKNALDLNADIYQIHSPEIISFGLALKKSGKRIIYDAHEDLPRHILEKGWIPIFMRKTISLMVEVFMNKSLAKYHEIISPHSHVVKQLKSINDNVTLITNFPIINNSVEVSLDDYLKRENIMCYTGTVYEYSNQEAILNAMLNIKDINYEIAGYFGDSHLERLTTHKAFNRVKFWGRIPWSQMRDFYDKTIIGLVIYDYKLNLGYKLGSYGTNKIFEYMEAGLPFICTDYDLWKDIVDKYNCGICVQPKNSKQIEDAINYLINNKEKAYQMGQNGRKAVFQEYNWATQAKIYIDIYRKHLI